jgi:hypothetical protein
MEINCYHDEYSFVSYFRTWHKLISYVASSYMWESSLTVSRKKFRNTWPSCSCCSVIRLERTSEGTSSTRITEVRNWAHTKIRSVTTDLDGMYTSFNFYIILFYIILEFLVTCWKVAGVWFLEHNDDPKAVMSKFVKFG